MRRRKRCPECKQWHSKWMECIIPTSKTGFLIWKPASAGDILCVTPVSGREEAESLTPTVIRRHGGPNAGFTHWSHRPKYVKTRPERYPHGRPRELLWVKNPREDLPVHPNQEIGNQARRAKRHPRRPCPSCSKVVACWSLDPPRFAVHKCEPQ